MKKEKKDIGIASSSIILAMVQCVTMCTGIVQTMILSRTLTKLDYGTYSEGVLIINFAIPFLMLGLSNAITYFSGQIDINVKKYINLLFSIISFLGIAGAIVIFIAQGWIVSYFDNPLLKGIMLFVAIRPLLQNLITAYQTLYIASGLSVFIAVRNFVISILQVVVIFLGAYLFQDIKIIFTLLIVLDVVQILLFASYFAHNRFQIQLKTCITKDELRRIFSYAIPLAVSSMVGTLTIYMDKLLIGKLMGTEDFAVYSNMSKELPFYFIVSSFTTVVTPVMIRLKAKDNKEELIRVWKNYLELGYRVTWILCGAAITCSKELLIFLYSEKYVIGYWIFVVYLFISFLRFSYFGIILSAYGKTKQIMIFSIATLVANLVLNYILFGEFGMIGPAIASLVVILSMEVMQLNYSCRLLQCKLLRILEIKQMLLLVGELIAVGVIVVYIKERVSLNSTIEVILFMGVFVTIMFMLNRKRIFCSIKSLNAQSIE